MTTQATIAKRVVPKRKSLRRPALLKRLVYEIVDGRPIYYRGYREVLNGNKTIEEIMGDGTLQAWLKLHLAMLIYQQIDTKIFDVTSGEQGLSLGNKHRRDADIAIFRRENLVLDRHYSKLPPEVIIEIDIEADTQDDSDMAYVPGKIADYFRFGVKKIVWIFSDSEKIMVATPNQPPQTVAWDQDVEALAGAKFNLADLLKNRRV